MDGRTFGLLFGCEQSLIRFVGAHLVLHLNMDLVALLVVVARSWGSWLVPRGAEEVESLGSFFLSSSSPSTFSRDAFHLLPGEVDAVLDAHFVQQQKIINKNAVASLRSFPSGCRRDAKVKRG
jgi:hypothetical protein